MDRLDEGEAAQQGTQAQGSEIDLHRVCGNEAGRGQQSRTVAFVEAAPDTVAMTAAARTRGASRFQSM